MALNWKVISQRNWLKGLQATFSRFSQPQGILTRLSNLLYDRRGGLRTTDGSQVFSKASNTGFDAYGEIPELVLYSPSGVTPYYIGLRQLASALSAPSAPSLTAMQVGGTISSASITSGVATITTTANHNLPAGGRANAGAVLVQSGNSNPQFNISVPWTDITVTGPTTYTYPTNLANQTGTGGTVGTQLGAGTYEYETTASDGVGGETPASGFVTVSVAGANNAVKVTIPASANAVGYNVYGRTNGGPLYQLNAAGPYPDEIVGATFYDFGGAAPGTNIPPGDNTSQALIAQILLDPLFGTVLGTFPAYYAPAEGGIPGAIAGPSALANASAATAQGGIIGQTCPLPQLVQFANKIILALGNGYAPQEYIDGTPSSGSGSLTPTNPPPVSASAVQNGSGSTTDNSSAISGFPSLAVTSSQISVSVTAQGTVVSGGSGAGGNVLIQVSVDGGGTWTTEYGVSTSFGPQQINLTIPSGLTNLNQLQIRCQALAFSGPTSYGSADGSITACVVSVGSSTSAGSIVAVSNTYSGNYTDWQASVAWNQGDIIHDTVTNGLFKATQAGTSAATRPSFTNTLNTLTPEVSPGTVVWQCIAASATGTPLRGAACAIVYSGSLWIANTWPVTTNDLLDGPCCIKMSDSNNPESWNPANVAFLDKDDGDWITALATYTIAEAGITPTGSLVIFKNFSTYQLTGVFGSTNLTIQKAQSDMGCIAGRSVQFMPGFGIMRLGHLGFAWFDGVRDRLASEAIRPYLFGGEDDITPIDWTYAFLSKGAQAADPPMYICACPVGITVLSGVTVSSPGSTNPLYVRVIKYTLGTNGQYTETAATVEVEVLFDNQAAVTVVTPAAVTGVKYRIFAGYAAGAENQYLEATSFNGTYVISSANGWLPGFSAYGMGGLSRLFCYDLVQKAWAILDLPFPISAIKQIRSPGTVPITVAAGAEDASVRRFFSGDATWDTGDEIDWSFTGAEIFQEGGSASLFYRRVVIRGKGDLGASVSVTLNLAGAAQTPTTAVPFKLGGTQWQLRVDIMKQAENANATVSGSGPARINLESMDWHVKAKASGAPVSIQK